MRDSTKVIIGFGSIWGLWALGATVLGSFGWGENDSRVELAGLLLYGLTILPACIVSIWFKRYAALWLIALAGLSGMAFLYQQIKMDQALSWSVAGQAGEFVVIAAIPGLLGWPLLRSSRDERLS